jgi:hypothetical protein
LRHERLSVLNKNGTIVPRPGFLKTVLESGNWRYYFWEIEALQEELKQRLAA